MSQIRRQFGHGVHGGCGERKGRGRERGEKGKEKGENGMERGEGEKRREWRKGGGRRAKRGVRSEKDTCMPHLSSGRERVRLVVLGGEGRESGAKVRGW